MVKEWDKKDVARRKALSQLQTKSPMLSATSDQKIYLEKVKEERLVKEELMSQDEEEDIPITEREMNLKGLASNWDLDMFREAQAKASKVIEEQLKGLPDVKGTKYMEMGRHQMEVGGVLSSRCDLSTGVVPVALSRGVHRPAEDLHLRVLPEVHEGEPVLLLHLTSICPGLERDEAPRAEVRVETPSRR